MTPFTCPTCGSETWKLIISNDKDIKKQVCPYCYKSNAPRPTYLHQKAEGAGASGLTEAKSRIIANRRISPEDHLTVIDKRTGRETKY